MNIFNGAGVLFVAEGAVEKDGARLLQYRYRVPEKASDYLLPRGSKCPVTNGS